MSHAGLQWSQAGVFQAQWRRWRRRRQWRRCRRRGWRCRWQTCVGTRTRRTGTSHPCWPAPPAQSTALPHDGQPAMIQHASASWLHSGRTPFRSLLTSTRHSTAPQQATCKGSACVSVLAAENQSIIPLFTAALPLLSNRHITKHVTHCSQAGEAANHVHENQRTMWNCKT